MRTPELDVVQGRESDKAQQLLRDARALEAAGCYAVVLECIPAELARIITSQLRIPTIGIGAGPHCDGQVLVIHDILGLCEKYAPKFVKKYADLRPVIIDAVSRYVAEVRSGEFPTKGHSFQ